MNNSSPPPRWLAISLAIFTDGTVYGHVEKQGTEAEVEAYIHFQSKRHTVMALPAFLKGKSPADYVLYAIQQTRACKNLMVSGPEPDAPTKN